MELVLNIVFVCVWCGLFSGLVLKLIWLIVLFCLVCLVVVS